MDKIKIFDYIWHIPHQFDLAEALKEDCEFYFCVIVKREWDTCLRPVPDNSHFVTHYEPGLYDFAILHIDQQVIDPNNIKSIIYNDFNEIIQDVPKIVINHGTPVFPEYFGNFNPDLRIQTDMEKRISASIKNLIGQNFMVVNSRDAAGTNEWGFGHPIVHGMNHNYWEDLPKEPRVFSALSPSGFNHYYNRKCMNEMIKNLYTDYGHLFYYAKINVRTNNSWEDYRNFLGRSLLYFDPSIRTPMNRSRTEAFLSGCCVIQVEGAHDLSYWAKNGENIILVPNDAQQIAKVINYYLESGYQEAIRIGQEGRKMAIERFSPSNYRKNWLSVFQQLTKR